MAQAFFDFQPARKVYSVSELSQEILGLFEKHFADVWVSGEVSNCRAAPSGHYYFTLKDSSAQLRAVCFRSEARYLKFKPQDGLAVVARGRLSLYEARGEYQLVVEYLEPAGLGALQLAFEQVKAKLAAEGLFDASRKKPLPLLPRTIGVVTSPAGAVIRDILRVLKRRYRNMNVLLYPVRVQGEGAAAEIEQAIRYFNRTREADVLILARGGGSLEDLWCFNEESVARAIAASAIPVISGVGHETDFTIADLVADLRAPTPSAAAERVVRPKQDFEAELENRARHLTQLIRLRLSEARSRLTELKLHRAFEALAAQVRQRSQRVDDHLVALERGIRQRLGQARNEWMRLRGEVMRFDPRRLLELKRMQLADRHSRLQEQVSRFLAEQRNRLRHAQALLGERNPLAILQRGYSITRDAEGRIIRDASQAAVGSEVSIRLARGELGAAVQKISRA